ncbi:hypothetical protein GP2143_13301 [marine gamma proteobacterium HTCC2143]|jgi:N-dimethylarginine dimethylaminohydrolase|uniref:Uncharacterized protein n=1 Tax=marine gamma proteobacterium HTCC2143 TaxID=247633 RepID=A0Y7Y0_9GAMM|nr:hypothetical protein GP2143_13301 [marine gamma proteobacterium HTCC2143]
MTAVIVQYKKFSDQLFTEDGGIVNVTVVLL